MIDDLFDRLLELSPDAMIAVGPNGKIVMINSQTETMFGYARADLIGKPIEMLIPKGAKQAIVQRPDLAVIYVSGYSAAVEAEESLEEGVIRLAKPYRKQALAVALRQVLDDDVSLEEA